MESTTSATLNALIAIPGNDKCCDCGLPDPRWASINLGITLCIECSGIHRSLGVHLSKVRSLNLDAWEPESMKVMSELGNDVVNSIYLSALSGQSPVLPTSPRQAKEAWIKAKYVERKHLAPLPFLLSDAASATAFSAKPPQLTPDAKDSPHSQQQNQPQQQQQQQLLPTNVYRWLVAPMPKKRDSKSSSVINNNNSGGRKMSTPFALTAASSSSSTPHSSPSAKASPKPPSPLRRRQSQTSSLAAPVVVEPPPATEATTESTTTATNTTTTTKTANYTPSPTDARAHISSPAISSSPSTDARLPSPMDVSETPTENSDEGGDDGRNSPISTASENRSNANNVLKDDKSADSDSTCPSASKDELERTQSQRDEINQPSSQPPSQPPSQQPSSAPPPDQHRLSQRRMSPPQESREQVLVFDGVGLWKTKLLGGEESRADADGGSVDTGSLGASSSSPSLSSTASGDPLREDILDDLSSFSANLLLFRAARQRNLRVMCLAMAHRATTNCAPFPADGRTPLMEAVASGSIAACEYLLLNGAKLDAIDVGGRRTALHHATILGHTGQVCQFLKRGANQGALDINGLDAISIAVNAANADIVTLLRLAKLNEEIKESELGNPGDATFSEVFKDFSNMAVEDPDQFNNRYQLLSQDDDGI